MERLGTPAVDRTVGPDRWLRYSFPAPTRVPRSVASSRGPSRADDFHEREYLSLRVRCRENRVASWTLDLSPGARSLRDAAERVGLWPDCAPDEKPDADVGLLRRPLPGPVGPAAYSLTAAVREGRIVQLTAFDEPPDWLDEAPP
jgi:hypothetical protein